MSNNTLASESVERIEVAVPSSAPSTYPIFVGYGLLSKLSKLFSTAQYSKVMVVLDQALSAHWRSRLSAGLGAEVTIVEVEAFESKKTLSLLEETWGKFAEAKLDRRSLVIIVGGGVLGDGVGFAASTYMRGIDFIQVPTTLLSQVDASVGGKVAVNFAEVKNLIGSFQQPRAVFIDTEILTTLPHRQYRSGFSEIIKHALIADKSLFTQLCTGEDYRAPGPNLIPLITRSCAIKAAIVQSDEREHGPRKNLNFGHTIGHAIESLALKSESPLLHGEAVSLGIVAESYISYRLGNLSNADIASIKELLIRFELPVQLTLSLDRNAAREKIIQDKKNQSGEIRWTLLKKIGEACFDQTAPIEYMEEALSHIGFK